MVAEREASLLLRGQDKGVNKLLGSVTKSSEKLSINLEKTASGFAEMGESIPTKSIKAFSGSSKNAIGSASKLNRSVRGLGVGYGGLISKTEKANETLEISENLFVKLGATVTGNKKGLDLINSSLGPAAGFWQNYSKATTSAGKSLVVVKTASKKLVPFLGKTSSLADKAADKFEAMGGAAAGLAKPMGIIAEKLGKTQKGLKVAGKASDLNLLFESVKEFKDETLPELKEQLDSTLETVEGLGVKEKFFGSTFKTLHTSATVLSATTKGLTKETSGLFLKFAKFVEIQAYVSVISNSMIEVTRTMSGVYQATEDLQSLGIDTTFQESALAVGIFGEKLLFSTEAAKKFRTEALGAFAQLQDQLAYLTTLSAAAEQGQKKLGKSIQDLVNGPIKNAISSLDAATGYYDAISAGQGSVDFLNASLKFSAATGAAAADSIGVLAQTHNIYRLNARDATKTAALFNATIENGVVNGQQLASGMGQLASVAKDAGIDLIELNSMFAALTKNGFNATDAFQGLMSLISSIAGQGSESAKAAQELGIRFDFARVKAEGLVSPINELYSAANGSSSKIKTIIPDALGYRTAMALATSASQDFVDVQDKMNNLDTSSLDTVFERRRDSILQRSEALKNGFQEEMIAFGESLQGSMEPALAASEKVLEKFRNLPGYAKNAILMSTTIGKNIDKVTKSGSILIGTFSGLAKAFLMAKAAGLVFTSSGRERLKVIYDLIKNQKEYTKAVQTFLGVSDKMRANIGNITGLEKTQLGVNQKLLSSRKTATKNLTNLTADNSLNLFHQTQGSVKKTIGKAFQNATPEVKARAIELRKVLQEQFVELRSNKRGSVIARELGLGNIKDTERDLGDAMKKINAKRSKGFGDIPKADAADQKDHLNLMEDNIKKRQEMMAMSKKQLAIEQAGIATLQTRIGQATADVKGNMEQGRDLVRDAIANKGNMVEDLKQVTVEQVALFDEDIANQIQNLAPEFADQLAGKTGEELEDALFQIRDNVDNEQVDQIAKSVDIRRGLIESSEAQTEALRNESKVLKKALGDRKLDTVTREKALEVIAQEVDARNANIGVLQENDKIDFLQIIGDEEIEQKIAAGFDTASEEVQNNVGKLAESLKSSSEDILDDDEAMSILDAIGLGDAQNSITELEGVSAKLEELKVAGEVDPAALALVEENLGQRRELAAATAAQVAVLRTENASLAENTIVLGSNNVAKATAIGFTGPLAAWNTKLAASYFSVTGTVGRLTGAQVLNTFTGWGSVTLAKTKIVVNGLWAASTSAVTAATAALSTALSAMWLALGPIGVGIIAVTAALAAAWKMFQHHTMLNEVADGFNNISKASEDFQNNLADANKVNEFASDLRDYQKELRSTAEAAELSGDKTSDARKKLDSLGDLGGTALKKTGKEFDTLTKVSMSGYIDQLDKMSNGMTTFNSASKEAFDSTIMNSTVEQTKLVTAELVKHAIHYREIGDEIKAIRLENLAEQSKQVEEIGDNFEKNFEDSLDEKELKAYKKNRKRIDKERAKFDRDALAKRGQLIRDTGLFATDQNNSDIIRSTKSNKVGNAIAQSAKKAKAEVTELEDQVKALENSSLLGSLGKSQGQRAKGFLSTSEKILEAQKKNSKQASFDAEAFKEMQQAEKDLLEERSAATDLRITNMQSKLDDAKENKVITEAEIVVQETLIARLKEENSEREKAFKLQQKRQKNAQAALSAIDINEAATSIEKLRNQHDTARARVLQETTSDLDKANHADFFKKLKADAGEIINMPKELQNASLDYYDTTTKTMMDGMTAVSAHQRRQIAIGINSSASIATNATETVEKGVTASRAAIDKQIEQINIMRDAGAILPETAAKMLQDVLKQQSQIDLTGKKGQIHHANQIEVINDGIINSNQIVANKKLKANEVAIAEIDHLHSIGHLTQMEAEEERFNLQVANSDMALEVATEKYDQLVKTKGANHQASIDSLNELKALGRADEKLKFDQARAAEQRAITLAEREVKVNQGKIAEIGFQEQTARITSFEAEEQRMDMEMENNRILFEIAQTRYNNIAAARGKDSAEALEAYGQLLAAERTYSQSSFTKVRAKEARKLALATSELEIETNKVVFAYQKQVDTLQLIADELQRQEKFTAAYNQTILKSIGFLDNIAGAAVQSIKDARTQAAVGEQMAKRNLNNMRLSQRLEKAAFERQVERNKLVAEQAIIQNDIAIASKQQEITLARMNLEQDKRNKKFRKDELEIREFKITQMNRELDLLGVNNEKLNKNLAVESEIADQNRTQMDLNHEQAKNGGVLDILNKKLEQMSAKYNRQQEIVGNMTSSLSSRLGFTTNMLGLAGKLTTDEQKQQRLAQIAAETKLKLLKQQHDLEQRMLEIQQAQQKSLLIQEKIKMRLLAATQKIAIAEDTKKLQEAQERGDTKAVQQIADVLEARYSALNVIESSTQELEKQQIVQEDLAAMQRQDLRLKQKGETYNAMSDVLDTKPEKYKKHTDRMKRRLMRKVLGEIGLDLGDTRRTSYKAKAAKVPESTGFRTPKDLNVGNIFQQGNNKALKESGVGITSNKVSEIDAQFKQAANGGVVKKKSIFDYMDPETVDQYKAFLGDGVAPAPVSIMNTPKIKSDIKTPTPEDEALPRNLVDLNQAQLEVQKELVRVLRGDKPEGEESETEDKEDDSSKKIEMHNELHFTVSQGEGEDIQSTVLGALESFVSQVEAGSGSSTS